MKQIKLVIITNNSLREHILLKKIVSSIENEKKNVQVLFIRKLLKEDLIKIYEFKPSVVLTSYLSNRLVNFLYVLKKTLQFLLLSINLNNVLLTPNSLRLYKIFSNNIYYGNTFIDHEMLFGRLSTELIGQQLLKQNKISSENRIHNVGPPVFEDCNDSDYKDLFSICQIQKKGQFTKSNTVLVLTKFQYADFINTDIVEIIGKKNNDVDFRELLCLNEKTKVFRHMWIRTIVLCAEQNPGLLFIVKIHPSEVTILNRKGLYPYAILNKFENILVIQEDIPNRLLIQRCNLLLHYGSKAMIEAYLHKVPTAYIYSKDIKDIQGHLNPFIEVLVESTISEDIKNVPFLVTSFANQLIKFKTLNQTDQFLKDQYAFNIDRQYKPSNDIAKKIVSLMNEKGQSISQEDRYLFQSILHENIGEYFINQLCQKALKLIQSSEYRDALKYYLDPAKDLAETGRMRIFNLENLRSICLLNLDQFDEAKRSIHEEIKNFPENFEAKKNYNDFFAENIISNINYGKRQIQQIDISNPEKAIRTAHDCLKKGFFNEYVDIYEQFVDTYGIRAANLLAELYDQYKVIEKQKFDRHILYQSRFFNFGIKPGDKVLDIGSGNIPFHLANFLVDFSIADNNYGRAGQPFNRIKGKPIIQCDIENMPFKDKEIDFAYCSHVLEHPKNPENACQEIIRIAKRGFIETPTRAKDMLLHTAKISNHRWAVELLDDVLIFKEYSKEDLDGLKTNLLMSMHCSPKTIREKAFSALLYVKANIFNVMLLWEDTFDYKVVRNSEENPN